MIAPLVPVLLSPGVAAHMMPWDYRRDILCRFMYRDYHPFVTGAPQHQGEVPGASEYRKKSPMKTILKDQMMGADAPIPPLR